MHGLGADRARIRAAVGPCIGQGAYQVGPEFEAAFLAQDRASSPFFSRGKEQECLHFDLGGARVLFASTVRAWPDWRSAALHGTRQVCTNSSAIAARAPARKPTTTAKYLPSS